MKIGQKAHGIYVISDLRDLCNEQLYSQYFCSELLLFLVTWTCFSDCFIIVLVSCCISRLWDHCRAIDNLQSQVYETDEKS